LENTRRWSAYVCPECRFVFRVPKDHAGKGVVCTSCQRLLRIPSARDTTLPLMTTMQASVTDQAGENADSPTLIKRRRDRMMGGGEDHTWDQDAQAVRPAENEKRSMGLQLLGGCALFAMIVGGVFVFMKVTPKSVLTVAAVVERHRW
jgi:hypothetical protein